LPNVLALKRIMADVGSHLVPLREVLCWNCPHTSFGTPVKIIFFIFRRVVLCLRPPPPPRPTDSVPVDRFSRAIMKIYCSFWNRSPFISHFESQVEFLFPCGHWRVYAAFITIHLEINAARCIVLRVCSIFGCIGNVDSSFDVKSKNIVSDTALFLLVQLLYTDTVPLFHVWFNFWYCFCITVYICNLGRWRW
jgi:hypothetical protein